MRYYLFQQNTGMVEMAVDGRNRSADPRKK